MHEALQYGFRYRIYGRPDNYAEPVQSANGSFYGWCRVTEEDGTPTMKAGYFDISELYNPILWKV